MVQMRFDFLPEIDDARNGTIEGMPAAGWVGRRFHATAEDALKEARRAAPLLGRLYVIEHPVDPQFQQYWPHNTYWQVSVPRNWPWSEVIGAFYYGRPNHYVVDYVLGQLTEVFVQGESKEEIEEGS